MDRASDRVQAKAEDTKTSTLGRQVPFKLASDCVRIFGRLEIRRHPSDQYKRPSVHNTNHS
jgi:hypothetical protein